MTNNRIPRTRHRTPTCIKLGRRGPALADWVILSIGIITLVMWAAGVFD